MIHVPYRGAGPALTDLLGGQVHTMFATLSSSLEYIKDGRLRSFGVTTAARSDVLPNVPTLSEFMPGYEASTWYGVGTPRGTPASIITKLNGEISTLLADPEMKARLARLGSAPLILSPSDLGKLIVEEVQKWGKVVRAANMKLE